MVARFSKLDMMRADEVAALGQELENEPQRRYLTFLFSLDDISKQLVSLRDAKVFSRNRDDLQKLMTVIQVALLALILWRVW